MPRAGFSGVPSVRVIRCVALNVSKQYHGSPRARTLDSAHKPLVSSTPRITRGDVVTNRLDDAARLMPNQDRNSSLMPPSR
jgi:hypothetical protein